MPHDLFSGVSWALFLFRQWWSIPLDAELEFIDTSDLLDGYSKQYNVYFILLPFDYWENCWESGDLLFVMKGRFLIVWILFPGRGGQLWVYRDGRLLVVPAYSPPFTSGQLLGALRCNSKRCNWDKRPIWREKQMENITQMALALSAR